MLRKACASTHVHCAFSLLSSSNLQITLELPQPCVDGLRRSVQPKKNGAMFDTTQFVQVIQRLNHNTDEFQSSWRTLMQCFLSAACTGLSRLSFESWHMNFSSADSTGLLKTNPLFWKMLQSEVLAFSDQVTLDQTLDVGGLLIVRCSFTLPRILWWRQSQWKSSCVFCSAPWTFCDLKEKLAA